MAFYQKGFIVGKLIAMSVKDFVGKNEKNYKRLSAFVSLPNGGSINIDKLIEIKEDICDYFSKSIEQYEAMIERLKNKETIYVHASIAPDGKGKMWDTISTYVNDEGKMNLKIGGIVKEADSEIDENEEVKIIFSKKETLFKDIDCSMTIEMIAKEIVDNEITFDSYGDYPVELIAYLPDGVENKAEIGQGYKLVIKVVKGKVKDVANEDGGDLNWNGEAKDPEFESDYFEIVKVLGKSKNYTDPNLTTDSSSSLLY